MFVSCLSNPSFPPPHQTELDKVHKVKMGVGNGLRQDVWREFLSRFGNVRMCEVYGSTEGNLCFMNHLGKIGTVGRSNFLFRVSMWSLVRVLGRRWVAWTCLINTLCICLCWWRVCVNLLRHLKWLGDELAFLQPLWGLATLMPTCRAVVSLCSYKTLTPMYLPLISAIFRLHLLLAHVIKHNSKKWSYNIMWPPETHFILINTMVVFL